METTSKSDIRSPKQIVASLRHAARTLEDHGRARGIVESGMIDLLDEAADAIELLDGPRLK